MTRPVENASSRLRLILVVSLLALTLVACGFQPRGQSAPSDGLPDAIAIVGERINSPLYRALRRQISADGSNLVGQPQDADMVLRIGARKSTSRLLSVDSLNRAVEFELEESARLSATDASGQPVIATQTVIVLRILFRPPDALLAGDREEVLLRQDMVEDLASRMLRRVAAQR